MPNELKEQDIISRNIRLIATTGNFRIYMVTPLLTWLWVIYTVQHLQDDNGLPTSHQRFIFAVIILSVLVTLLAMVRGEQIKSQLERAGYTQRRARSREIKLAINFAVLAASVHWGQKYEGRGGEGAFVKGLAAVGFGVVMWWTVVLVSLGPVLWFTVRVR